MVHMRYENENWASFKSRTSCFPQRTRDEIEWAYQICKSAHREQFRENGEPYRYHPRRVALIHLDELHSTNHRVIVGSLLHDTAEDSAVWGTYQDRTYPEWREIVGERITRAFGSGVAEIVLNVSKPIIDGETIKTKTEMEEIYLENLLRSSAEAKLVKMGDRLDNLRTLQFVPREKRLRKIDETVQEYFPIFERIRLIYPQETKYLMDEMQIAIDALKQ